MKSELAKKLKEVLDNMSQEQFDMEWNAISALNMEGPTFEEAIEYYLLVASSITSKSEIIDKDKLKELLEKIL
jgi:DNA-binding TFAR19-related protein (PDSD5 family)